MGSTNPLLLGEAGLFLTAGSCNFSFAGSVLVWLLDKSALLRKLTKTVLLLGTTASSWTGISVRHLQCTAQSCVAGEDDSGWGEMRQLPCWDKWNISVSQSADASCLAPDVLGPDLSARWLRSSVGETPLGSCVVRPRDVPAVEMRETPEPLLRGARDGCKDCYKCLLVWIFCLLKINTLQLWDTSTYVQEPELNQQIVVWSLELSSGTRGCCADLLASMICKL